MCKLIAMVGQKLVVMKVLVHIRLRDEVVEEVEDYQVGNIDVEQ